MKSLLILTVFALVGLASCQNNQEMAVNINKSVSNSANVQTTQPTQPVGSAAVKTGQGLGVVTKINLEAGSVELNHGEIKGMMPAMQMEFYVADKKELQPLKTGDKVVFTLEDDRGAEKITKISKTE